MQEFLFIKTISIIWSYNVVVANLGFLSKGPREVSEGLREPQKTKERPWRGWEDLKSLRGPQEATLTDGQTYGNYSLFYGNQ